MPEKAGVIPKYAEIAKEIRRVADYAKRNRSKTGLVILFI